MRLANYDLVACLIDFHREEWAHTAKGELNGRPAVHIWAILCSYPSGSKTAAGHKKLD